MIELDGCNLLIGSQQTKHFLTMNEWSGRRIPRSFARCLIKEGQARSAKGQLIFMMVNQPPLFRKRPDDHVVRTRVAKRPEIRAENVPGDSYCDSWLPHHDDQLITL